MLKLITSNHPGCRWQLFCAGMFFLLSVSVLGHNCVLLLSSSGSDFTVYLQNSNLNYYYLFHVLPRLIQDAAVHVCYYWQTVFFHLGSSSQQQENRPCGVATPLDPSVRLLCVTDKNKTKNINLI